jgi:hypothetical protein
LLQFVAQNTLETNQNDPDSEFLDGSNRSFDFGLRGVIAPHCVDRDRQLASAVLFLNDLDNLPAFVLSAVRADAVRELRFVAIRTLGHDGPSQRIVRAARGGSPLRVPSFWIWHCL